MTITQTNQPLGSAFTKVEGMTHWTSPGTVTVDNANKRITLEVNHWHGGLATFFNGSTGIHGCTPGFWKNYKSTWPVYSRSDQYRATFGISSGYNGTLEQAIDAGGGGWNALARHSVAALLNATAGFYPMTVAEVITLVQNAANGTIRVEAAKNQLEVHNELGCPLSNNGK